MDSYTAFNELQQKIADALGLEEWSTTTYELTDAVRELIRAEIHEALHPKDY